MSDLVVWISGALATQTMSSDASSADLQAELASTKQTLVESQTANAEWTEYANGLAEAKTALEVEVSDRQRYNRSYAHMWGGEHSVTLRVE